MNKKAIVLGGSRGIGKAISDHLRELGCVVESLSSKQVDTSKKEDIEKFLETHKDTDILVLNTGGPPAKDFFKITEEEWQKYYFQLFYSFVKILQEMKIKNGGYVFLISSYNVKEPDPNLILSNCFRLAFISVFKSLSKIMGKNSVNFINIAPGPIDTDRLNRLCSDKESLEKKIPMKYIASASEIGIFVKSIVENNIKYLNGVTINFDGGMGNYVL